MDISIPAEAVIAKQRQKLSDAHYLLAIAEVQIEALQDHVAKLEAAAGVEQ
jgi:hypothetical protein